MSDYEKDIKVIDQKIESIIKDTFTYMKGLSKDYIKTKIKKAYEYAKDAHKWQIRLSWQPYINHPVDSTQILLTLTPDIASIQACLLHDVIEDTPKTYEDIKKDFWEEVAFLCAWMEKLWKVRYKWEDRAIWSLRKMFVAMAEDLRVILIKLSDRLHNMQTLNFHPKKEKRDRIALETLNIYAPIAERLGLYKIKSSLEEECFKILKPKEYKEISLELEKIKAVKANFKDIALKEMDKLLTGIWVKHEVHFRIKSIYSIYKKMKRKDFENIEDLYDIYWIRIIVETISDCYRVLWEIHSKWHPLPYRFKDYIALPKPNGYKSLHTTIIWFLKSFTKQPTEIQIRTFNMNKEAEIWVAAHFEYKEVWSKVAKDINWVKELKELTESLWNRDLMSSLKIDVFKNRIFVFTPKWDPINLPSGSTPIDFAYYVHTDLWNHITLAKVNHSVYPLDKELRNWDIVDIVIDKNKKPSPFRLSFVKTSKAKTRIRSYLKKENKDAHRERWRDIMNNYLEKSWLKTFDKDLSILKVIDGKEHTMEERLQLLEQVWNFSVTPASLIRRIFRDSNKTKSKPKKWVLVSDKVKKITKKDIVVIWWEEWLPFRVCKCIKWWLSEKMVAHINSKWIFHLHRRDCKVLNNVNKDRLLSAYIKWQEDNVILVRVILKVINKLWVLKSISETLFAMNINLEEIKTSKIWTNKTSISLLLEIPDYDYLLLDRFVDRIKLKLKDRLVDFKIEKIKYN